MTQDQKGPFGGGLFGGIKPEMLGLLAASAGLMQAGGPSRTPVSTGAALGQGLMGGIGAYQQAQQMDQMNQMRTAQIGEMKRKAEEAERLRSVRAGLIAPTQVAAEPQPTIEKSASGPVEVMPVSFNQPIVRGLDAPAPPAAGGFQPIPIDKLAQAAAEGIDIKPFIALNNEARPDVHYQDAGDRIIVTDKKSLRVLETLKKGAAPGSVPYEASDITPEEFREHQKRKATAGAVRVELDSLGLKPLDRFNMEGRLRDDFRGNPTVKAADEMQSAFTLIKAAYERPSAANDLAMATKYMKILDPTSVVRESEFALAVNATGLLDKVQNYAASILEGKKLNPTQRKDFYESAAAINESFQKERDGIAARFSENAAQYNLSPDNVVGKRRKPPATAPAAGAFSDPDKERRYQEWKARQ